jgi:glycosyltransferase involved in cell wall biosynthesis
MGGRLDVSPRTPGKVRGMSDELPRVLVVTSNNFNLVNGGGITLTNLFRGWPHDRLANLHDDALPEDHSVCRTFYRLTEEEIRWIWPFSLARAWYGRKKQQAVSSGGAASGPGRDGWLSRVKRVLGDGAPKRARLTPALIEWVETFRPALLYGFLGSLEQITLIRSLAARFRLPMVIHMMDDWPAVLHTSGLLSPIMGPLIRQELRNALKEARARLAICDEMGEEYQRRYGYEFRSFQNALDPAQWLPFARNEWQAGAPFIVRYVGSIVPAGQKESLKDIAKAVARLRKDGRKIQLRIHAPWTDADYLRDLDVPSDALSIEGPPDAELVPRLLASSDLLVLPYNFDARSARYIRLSLPTKAPAYMMSATPILVYAPADAATARYAAQQGWAYVVSLQGEEAVTAALKVLMGDTSLRERLGRRAQTVALARHDAEKVRAAFWDCLAAASRRA